MRSVTQNAREIAERARTHLESAVRIDSASDERSDTIPSTPGQAELAEMLVTFFEGVGATVERDDYANVIASLPGRGAELPPLALMVHLDTARGTQAIETLEALPDWQGDFVPYPRNQALRVGVETYPTLSHYVGQTLLFGPGDAPFGLDDKLGLAHMMTLAWLLQTNDHIDHPPLVLIARPDEEIGRMEALSGIADLLAERGVTHGYTLDGLEPFEINIENFNASQASLWFEGAPLGLGAEGHWLDVSIGGVNTHGATAKAEGHRAATRLAAEVFQLLERNGADVVPVSFESDSLRDCDARLIAFSSSLAGCGALAAALQSVIGPHTARGASFNIDSGSPPDLIDSAAREMLRWVHAFMECDAGFELLAEESEGFQGYSHPYRARSDGSRVKLDVRLRDFTPDGLKARAEHVRERAADRPVELVHQYINMGPRLADRPELVSWARSAAEEAGVEAQVLPIRGGTGVDPFLERGIAIANLGTGYFSPESEKELTSLETMAGHAAWLVSLVQIAHH